MQRISTTTKAFDLFGVGKHGFKDGDLGLGILPTDFSAEWCNGMQEEVMAVIEGAGLTPDANNLNQLRDAIALLIASGPTASTQQPGEVCFFARNTAPTGFLKANGAPVSRTTFAELFTAIGVTFGAGDGATTFNLPDLRGEFVRGWDEGRGVDSGRLFGTIQSDDFKSHSHDVINDVTQGSIYGRFFFGDQGSGDYTNTNYTSSTGGTETRPRNWALLACIKY